MATVRLKYVKAYEDRHGTMRYYFRRAGFPAVALPGKPGSKEFAHAYTEAMKNAPRMIGEKRVEAGSFDALIAEFYQTDGYKDLAEITRRTYRNVLERFRSTFGDMQVKSMTPKLLDELLEGTEKNVVTVRKVLRLILKLAVRRHYIKVNPMAELRMARKAKEGFHTWTEEEIAQYEAKWPSGSRERLALALLLYAAPRRADVVRMGRQHLKDGAIHFSTSKSGHTVKLVIPVHPLLKVELDQVPGNQMGFIQTAYGAQFSAAGFGNWFRECAKDAGLTGCTAHGLRKACCRRLADAGATPHEIMAITGHKNLAEVTLYTEAANQKRLAQAAIEKIAPRTEASTPESPVRQSGENS